MYGRRRHLDQINEKAKHIKKLYYELLQHEKLGRAADRELVATLKREIEEEEENLWKSHHTFCGRNVKQSEEYSRLFMNVFQCQQHCSKEMKRQADLHNRQKVDNPNLELKSVFTNAETAFLRWYVSIFGDNWRLIADVLGYHPLTRGPLRKKDQVKNQFIWYVKEATKANLITENTVIKPWRTTGQPILIPERPPSLYSYIKQTNQMHHTCIKNLREKQDNPRVQTVYRLFEDEHGVLSLE